MESSIPSSDRLNQICMRYMRSMTEFFSNIELGVDTFKTINGNEFTVTSVDDKHINISIPGNATVNKLTLSLDEVRKMLESGQKFDKIRTLPHSSESHTTVRRSLSRIRRTLSVMLISENTLHCSGWHICSASMQEMVI